MGTVPSPTSDWPAASQRGVALPLLTVTFLIGIGLVSLVDLLSDETETIPPIEIPSELESGPFMLVAPGWEAALASFDEPEQVTVIPPWGRLPEAGWSYVVILSEGTPMPRVPADWDVTDEQAIGAWRLVEVLNTQQAALEANYYDFAEHIDAAHVFFRSATGEVIPCDRWRFGRWSCGLEEWLWVGPTEQIVRGRSESCLWAHPLAQHELVLQFTDVPRGTRVIGRYGLSDVAVEVPDGASVELTVRAAEHERTVVAENRRGLSSFQLRLEEGDPDTVDVEFIITAENDGRRHFCFDGGMQGIGARHRQSRLETSEPPEADEAEGSGQRSGTGQAPEGGRSRTLSRDRRIIRPGPINLDLRPTLPLDSTPEDGTGGAP